MGSFSFLVGFVVVLEIGYCVDVPTTKVLPKTTKVVKTTTLIDTNGTTIRMNLTRTKCFPFVGCFDNLPPFDNAALDLPRSPKEVGTQMQLFTRKNPKTGLQHGYFLDFMDLDTINNSPFNHTRKTKFIIHGFTNSIKTPWIYEMKDELLKLDDFNVIIVTWGPGATFPDYDQAVANTRMVGTQMRLIIDMMVDHARARLSDIHLIGHSLGAHTAGFTGWLLHGQLGRITGMDAAEPDFEHHPIEIRLDSTDAKFVDVIHTNGASISSGGAGLMEASGHVDFYVNGGEVQPDCPNQLSGALSGLFGGGVKGAAEAVACSHSRSHEVFAESINTACPFTAYPCKSFDEFNKGNCLSCEPNGCSQLGYFADMYHARGKLYLNTRLKKPFCGFHYVIKLVSGATTSYGSIKVRLHGNFGTTDWITYIDNDELTKLKSYSKMIISPIEVGEIQSVELQYVKRPTSFLHWFGGEDNYNVVSFEVTSGEIGGTYHYCLRGNPLVDKRVVTATKSQAGSC